MNKEASNRKVQGRLKMPKIGVSVITCERCPPPPLVPASKII